MRPLRALLVDDDVTDRRLLRAMLERALQGSCVEACSGEEALGLLRDGRFDVVVSDFRMGFLDGVQLLEIVRRDHPGTCRILITGHAHFETVMDAINRAGVHALLQKPVELRSLERVLRLGMERASSEAGSEA